MSPHRPHLRRMSPNDSTLWQLAQSAPKRPPCGSSGGGTDRTLVRRRRELLAVTVASRARHALVRARQREARLRRVIERRRVPIARVVTRAAGRAERAVVRVLRRMAIRAARAGVVECERRVTARALERRVLAEQRERDEIVIEPRRRSPSGLRVARVAARADLAACGSSAWHDAQSRLRARFDAGRVAARALDRGVRARKREAADARV